MERIRGARKKPGLLRQHLTAVQSAVAVAKARVTGAELGSSTLSFHPSRVQGGEYRCAVGTAGSATLVLQAILPALITASESSRLTLEGGTHNPSAPPYDFLATTFLPLLRKMGASVVVNLEAHGFYPAGGGRFTAAIESTSKLAPLSILERGETRVSARAIVSGLPEHIARRELSVVRARLGIERTACRAETAAGSIGPGNVLMVTVESGAVTEVITSFGMKGVTAEKVAEGACVEAQAYLAAAVPVGVHLADQLLIPMALAGAGSFRTMTPSAHTISNARVIREFLDVSIDFEHERDDVYRVNVSAG